MLDKIHAQITTAEKNIEKMEHRRKTLMQKYKTQERKERTHRLCKRGGLLESIFPNVLNLSDTQTKSFLEMTLLTDYSQKMYNNVINNKTATADVTATTTIIKQSQSQSNRNQSTPNTTSQSKTDKNTSYEEYLETLREE